MIFYQGSYSKGELLFGLGLAGGVQIKNSTVLKQNPSKSKKNKILLLYKPVPSILKLLPKQL